jgi:hypothetical protein
MYPKLTFDLLMDDKLPRLFKHLGFVVLLFKMRNSRLEFEKTTILLLNVWREWFFGSFVTK